MAATGLFSLAGFNEILSPNNMTWCLMPDTRLRFFHPAPPLMITLFSSLPYIHIFIIYI